MGTATLPEETAEEVFRQALGFKRRSTAISENLYEICCSEQEFHLILCLVVRVMEEAKAWRQREEKQPKKGEFKKINPRTFGELAEQFGLDETMLNKNYSEAINYHRLRKPKSPKRKTDEIEATDEEMSKSLSPKTPPEEEQEDEQPSTSAVEIVYSK